jgi:MFS family permease
MSDLVAISQPAAPVTAGVRRRLMAALFGAQSINSAAMTLAFTPLSIVAALLTGNEALAGVPATVLLLGRAGAAFPIGALMDRRGRRAGISLGLLGAVIGSAVIVVGLLQSSFALFLFGVLLTGMGRGASEQARYVAADIEPPERVANGIGTLVFANTVGAVLGPLLLPWSEGWAEARGVIGLAGPYVLATALTAAALATVFIFLRPDPRDISLRTLHATAHAPAEETARRQGEVFRLPAVQLAILTLAISQLVMTLIMVITPLHMQHEHHDMTQISLVIAAHTLGMFGLSGLTGRMTARFGPLPLILAGALILAASAILAPLAQGTLALAVALFLLGLGWNFGFVAGSALLTDALRPGERGKTQGLSETLVAVASAAGSLSTGVAFQYGGLIAVSMIGLALVLALITAFFLTRRRPAYGQ